MKLTREEIEKMEAGQDIDLLISDNVMKWSVDEWNSAFFSNRSNFSTSMSAAWKVIEKLHAISHQIEIIWEPDRGVSKSWVSKGKTYTGTPELNKDPHPYYKCHIMFMSKEYPQCWSGGLTVNANTAPLAICRAALLAVMVTE